MHCVNIIELESKKEIFGSPEEWHAVLVCIVNEVVMCAKVIVFKLITHTKKTEPIVQSSYIDIIFERSFQVQNNKGTKY